MSDNTAIRIKNITRRFGSLKAVDGLSLDIMKGEALGLLGPNGAGKSTTINMICGLLKPDTGKIEYSNEEQVIPKLSIGLCPQENIFWPQLSCIEQLEFMGEMYGLDRKTSLNRGEGLLEQTGLTSKKNNKAATLSGGMKRRLNICLALVHDPEIIILDEPEAGLDPQSRILIRDFIKHLAEDKTVILSTHNMDEADRLSDRIAIIDKGRLLKTGPPDALKREIGEGDIVEIEITAETAGTAFGEIIELLESRFNNLSTDRNILSFRTNQTGRDLADIIELLGDRNISTGEIKIRPNTLEDVFISLTGRKLRD